MRTCNSSMIPYDSMNVENDHQNHNKLQKTTRWKCGEKQTTTTTCIPDSTTFYKTCVTERTISFSRPFSIKGKEMFQHDIQRNFPTTTGD